MVLIDRDISSFPSRSNYVVIGLDNFSAGYIMTEHLIQSGCERIYFFYRKNSAGSIYKRIAGCNSACFDAGIFFSKKNIFAGEPSDIDFVKQMEIIPKKTGILCANDSTAAVIMSSVNQIGAKVSVDLLVAGFDDMKYGKVLQAPLTTYKQPLSDIVAISYDMMLNKILNANTITANINLTGELIIRESTRFL